MTEAEAQTKFCPFARLDGDGRNMEVIGGYAKPATFCIGSACMAWRESPPPPEIVGPVHGFCGLAGSPQ